MGATGHADRNKETESAKKQEEWRPSKSALQLVPQVSHTHGREEKGSGLRSKLTWEGNSCQINAH